ncbi:MAG: hypothetical protein GY943_06220 [Chloroflexi bacterium]|nr:hypothetical protein [Chloroflexota bacterium]
MKKWLRNPSIQFFITFLFSPIVAMIGGAIGGYPSWEAYLGAMITCVLIAITAGRSIRHERKQFPSAWPRAPRFSTYSTMTRYLVAVGIVWVFAVLGILFFAGAAILMLLQ